MDKSHLCIKVWALSSRWGVLAASIKLWQLSYFSYAHLTFSLATHIYETLPRGVGHFKMPKVPLEILSSPLLFCNWKVLDTGHKGCTKTKAILFEVVPITRPSFFKLHLNKGYLILKMGPLKLLFYLTFVNWCTKGESPNKIRNVNVFGWNEIQKVELIILKTGILDTNRSTLFAYYMRWRESQKKSIFYLAWVKLFFMFPLQLCGRCSADRFEEQPGLQHRLHCHQHYRHG